MSFQGKRNIYTCDTCHDHVVTWDREAGVTPFMIRCQRTAGCTGMMTSSMYRVFDQSMRPDREWYRPGPEETLTPGAAEHVARGGLLLREFPGEAPNPPAAPLGREAIR